ncbi:putative receptor-like protein kinase [Carex littledalei]|uniref:Putative receptor-like protein kinase n=1 Tax=Carex littledalei TaxID=544730 RepID=A0A833Q6C5_9POAL|nr:putative receptor-like protein kinase [Carex littledalei]
MGVRCNFHYEVYSFYSGVSMVNLDATTLALAPAPVLQPTGSTGKKADTTIIDIAVAIPGVAAWKHWTAGTVPRMIDTILRDCPTNEIVRYVHIALLCVQDDQTDRPKMSEVVIMLSSNTISLQAPSRPPFCITNTGS